MKKVVFTLALTLLFALSMMAQTSTPPSSNPSSSDQNAPAAQQSNPNSDQSAQKPQGDQSTAAGTEHKGHHDGGTKTVTGCLSGPNAEGNYVLTSKKGKTVEVAANDALKEHVGHEVKLTGSFASASTMGATSTKAESKEKHFTADKVDMVSESCTKPSAKSDKSKKGEAPANPGL
jgi:hypothetical protein